jgi:hypothetical protein
MRRKLLSLLLALSPALAAAPRQPVLLELFTSQGCSSCPPAEGLIEDLDQRQPLEGLELIPLVFHVDYWDRLGWKDPFAAPAWTQRQYGYAALWKSEQVYTPQAVINGTDAMVGSDRRKILGHAKARPALSLERHGAEIGIRGLQAGVPLWVALTQDGQVTRVLRGENGGRTLKGHGIVLALERLGFTGAEARYKLPATEAQHLVAFQQRDLGPVLSAGRLDLR